MVTESGPVKTMVRFWLSTSRASMAMLTGVRTWASTYAVWLVKKAVGGLLASGNEHDNMK